MVGYPLRDRRRTPQGVRAVLSPSGIVLAGVVVGVSLAVGAPLVVGLPLAAVAWAGAATWGARRAGRQGRRGERIDPFTLQDPWRRFVQQALQARRRLDVSLREVPPGPLADRLHDVGGRIHAALHESWLVAKRGQALADARRRIDVRRVDRQLAELRRGPADGIEVADRSLDSGQARRQDAVPPPGPAETQPAEPTDAASPQPEPDALEAVDPHAADQAEATLPKHESGALEAVDPHAADQAEATPPKHESGALEAVDPAEPALPPRPGALEAVGPGVAGLVESLEAQKATAARLDGVISRAQGELQLLDARMNEAVARVAELSTTSAPEASVGALGSDIDGLVMELEALRRALDEAYGTEPGGLPPGES